jgi:predicted mannosyl-3-phosphoglycerate phosphatase (HAD superfamily)
LSFQLVVFTDLDGTLLDHQTYSFQAARPMINKLLRLGIPIVINTSKTRAETEILSRRLKLNHPFIVENGGAVFIPEGCFEPAFFQKTKHSNAEKGPLSGYSAGDSLSEVEKIFGGYKKKNQGEAGGIW